MNDINSKAPTYTLISSEVSNDGALNVYLLSRPIDIYDTFDSEEVRELIALLNERYPSKHCTHAYDCCGHLYPDQYDLLIKAYPSGRHNCIIGFTQSFTRNI